MSTEVAVNESVSMGESPSKKSPVSKKRRGKTKAEKMASNHPPYGDMIKSAIIHLNDSKGSSRAAVLKYIIQTYSLGDNLAAINAHLRLGLKRGVASGMLKQVKGTGASGSFKLSESKSDSKSKKNAEKKPAVATVKKSSPKKVTAKPKKKIERMKITKTKITKSPPKKVEKTKPKKATASATPSAPVADSAKPKTTATNKKSKATKKATHKGKKAAA